jgi:transcriptional regulator GlxA family with amidase domain
MRGEHQTIPTSTRHNSTNMDPIQAAIEAHESQEPGEQFPVQEVADKYGVWRSTMQRRMAGQTVSRIEQSTNA